MPANTVLRRVRSAAVTHRHPLNLDEGVVPMVDNCCMTTPNAFIAPTSLGPVQVLRHTGLEPWQWDAGQRAGMIPATDVGDHRWSIELADAVHYRAEAIIDEVGREAPLGGNRAAQRLSEDGGAAATKADIVTLVNMGVLRACGEFKSWPLYSCRDLDNLDPDLVVEVVAEREERERYDTFNKRSA